MTSKEERPRRLSPIHPGEVLNEDFPGPLNITQYRLAKSTGVDPKAWLRSHAVPGVIPRLPRITPLTRPTGTSMCFASRDWVIPNGVRNSSSRISPGCGGFGGELFGSACGIRTRDLRLERAVSWASRRTRHASGWSEVSGPWGGLHRIKPEIACKLRKN